MNKDYENGNKTIKKHDKRFAKRQANRKTERQMKTQRDINRPTHTKLKKPFETQTNKTEN